MLTLADAIIEENISDVEYFIQQGADLNEIDVYGYTPLIEAAIMNNMEIAILLLRNPNILIDFPDVTGRTALYWAVDNNNIPLCQLLLKRGANPNVFTTYSEPMLVMPLLRDQTQLKELLYQYGASLPFAQDYINAKLLAHRYELIGYMDIVNAEGKFVEIDFEGFVLPFTVSIVGDSLKQFLHNFMARPLRAYFPQVRKIIKAFHLASAMLRFQKYTIDIEKYKGHVDALLGHELMLIPVGYEGHAITFIRYRDLWAKCDRGENSKKEGSVVIYRMRNPSAFTKSFVKTLVYKKQYKEFVHHTVNQILDLEKIDQLPIPSQLVGNCSWANVEASIPAMLYLFAMEEAESHPVYYTSYALSFFEKWREWDKNRALNECIQSFYRSNSARKASKAALLGALLFQKCKHSVPQDVELAQKILHVLTVPEYKYVLESYIEVYYKKSRTQAGVNLFRLLQYCDVVL